MFQHADDPVALAVDLANTWDTLEDPPELLGAVADLRRFLARRGIEGRVREGDLTRARAVRDSLRAAFSAADVNAAVDVLNRLLRDAGALPQLASTGAGWRCTYASADVVDAVAASAAASLLEAVRDDGWDRFGVCAGAPCCCVFVDRSKNRSRRFCSTLCADRIAQASHRSRVRGTS